MKQRIITIFGGSGFVGKYVAAELAKEGFLVQIASRDPEKAIEVKTAGSVGQITLTNCDIKNYEQIEKIIKNSYGVVNLVGLLFESGKQNFDNIHVNAANNISKAAKKCNVKKFIQLSALAVDKTDNCKYALTKLRAEKGLVLYLALKIISSIILLVFQ